MNIPAYFYLRKKKWTVVLSDDRKWHHDDGKIIPSTGEPNRCFGETDPNTRTITLWHDQKPRAMLGTWIHEYLHAVEFEYDLKIPHRIIHKLEKPLVSMILLLMKVEK